MDLVHGNDEASTASIDFVRSVAMELLIFVTTVCLALLAKRMGQHWPLAWYPNGAASCHLKAAKFYVVDDHEDESPTDDVEEEQQDQETYYRRPPHGQSHRARSKATHPRSPATSQTLQPYQPGSPAAIIDSVVDSMHHQPGVKAANRALAAYAELQLCLRDGQLISSFPRQPRSSLEEFFALMVQSATRTGKCHMVESLLDEMKHQGAVRSHAFYESTMKQLAGQKQYQLALALYDRMAADGLEPSAITYSCLISFAAEVGQLNRAIFFFEKLSAVSTPSIRAYMTVLRVHAKRGAWEASLAIFKSMQERGVRVDNLVLNIIMSTGVSVDRVEGVEELLRQANEMAPPISDLVSYNTLMKGYAHRSDGAKALQLLTSMREGGLTPNAISFNTCMDALVRGGRTASAWELLAVMRNAALSPDKFTCSILVKGLSKGAPTSQISGCLMLLKEVGLSCEMGLRSTLYHSIQDVADASGKPSLVLQTFQQMCRNNVVPSATAYRLLLQAVAQEPDFTKCKGAWETLLNTVPRPQPAVLVSALEAWLKQGRVQECMSLFRRLQTKLTSKGGLEGEAEAFMEECRAGFIRSLCKASRELLATQLYSEGRESKRFHMDHIAAMALAALQVETGNIQAAWLTVSDMLEAGEKPGETLLQALLTASCHSSKALGQCQAEIGHELSQRFARGNISLSSRSQLSLLKLVLAANQLPEALLISNQLVQVEGGTVLPSLLPSVLKLCFSAGQPSSALELARRLHGQGAHVCLDAQSYEILVLGLSEAGLVAEAAAIAADAQARGGVISAPVLASVQG